MTKIIRHPFVEGIQRLIEQHFSPEISKNFRLDLEANVYSKDLLNIRKQIQDQRFYCEVRYYNPDGSAIYICEVFSDWSRKQTEWYLLKHITDKFAEGEIGKDWVEDNGKIGVSKIITDRTYETKTEGMVN